MSVKRYEFELYHCNGGEMLVSDTGDYVSYEDYAALEQKLAESQREFRAADATIENLQMQLNAEREAKLELAAENAGLKDINAWCKTDAFKNMYREFKTAEAIGCHDVDCMHDAMLTALMHAPETPVTDAFLAEVRAQGVEMFAEKLREHIAVDSSGSTRARALTRIVDRVSEQIRKGVQP